MLRMKSLSIFATLFLVAFSIAFAESPAEKSISEAKSRYYEAQSRIRSVYRKDFASTLAQGDRVEVYLLDFEAKGTPSYFKHWEEGLKNDEFPILPYGSKSKILERVTLTEVQRRIFIPKLQEVVGIQGDIDGGAFCHFPIHGVRIYVDDVIIFQSSFCWKCNNFGFSYPDRPTWVAIRGGDLFKAFSVIMPIPQFELNRFEAKYGSKRGKNTNKAEQDGAGQPATAPGSKPESEDEPKSESEGHPQ